MDGTVWDIARMGHTAGIELTATLHPDRITTRMRNSIKRMVASGQLSGWEVLMSFTMTQRGGLVKTAERP